LLPDCGVASKKRPTTTTSARTVEAFFLGKKGAMLALIVDIVADVDVKPAEQVQGVEETSPAGFSSSPPQLWFSAWFPGRNRRL